VTDFPALGHGSDEMLPHNLIARPYAMVRGDFIAQS
jgi:hypothetical protein